jgi:membrane associated rhomboid family serine protease
MIGLIGLAAITFAGEQMHSRSYAEAYGAVPAVVVSECQSLRHGEVNIGILAALSRLITALFLHGSAEHILLNVVFLWAFGFLISEILGQLPMLALFLVTGICGNIVQVCLNVSSEAPIIGASGAICGLGGAYFGLALRWNLPWPDVWPLAHPIPPLQLGAFSLLGFIGDMYFLADRAQGIAFGAHAGGFVAGFAIAALVTTIYPTPSAYNRRWR